MDVSEFQLVLPTLLALGVGSATAGESLICPKQQITLIKKKKKKKILESKKLDKGEE